MRRTAPALALLALLLLAAAPPSAAAAGGAAAGGAAAGGGGAAGASTRDPGWVWPVDGPRVVVRAFLAPAQPWSPGHRGVDLLGGAAGTEVRAVLAGTVHFAGVVVDRPVITVRDGPLLVTVEPVLPVVAEGDSVAAGQLIGTLLPGHCTDAEPAELCVHLGVRLAGEYVSPLLSLGGLQRAVLLPLGGP